MSHIQVRPFVPSPPAEGYLRVATLQIDYHPAAISYGRSLLEDPLGSVKETVVLPNNSKSRPLREKRKALYRELRSTYVAQLRAKLAHVVKSLEEWHVDLAVFPEYSVPPDLLNPLAVAAESIQLLAGTHTVTRQDIAKGCYSGLAVDAVAPGQALAPVLHGGRLHRAQAKLCPSDLESDFIPASDWMPIPVIKFDNHSLGVLVCLDFLYRDSPLHIKHVIQALATCRLTAVPSLTPGSTIAEFAGKAREDAKRGGRSVLHANIAREGGTRIYVDERDEVPNDFPEGLPPLPRGEEGVLIADIDMMMVRPSQPGARRHDSRRATIPVANATLLYSATKAHAEYVAWLRSLAATFSTDGFAGGLARVITEAQLVQHFADRASETRQRRLNLLAERADAYGDERHVYSLLCDLVLPVEVLPLGIVEELLLGIAKKQVRTWPESDDEFDITATILKELGKASGRQS